MSKVSLLRYAAIGMASLGLAGIAAASTVTVTNSGPDSSAQVGLTSQMHTNVNNNNHIGLANFNGQEAYSGDATAHENTSVTGGVGTGNAANANTTNTSIALNNTAPTFGAGAAAAANNTVGINLSGPDSSAKVDIKDNTTLNLTNNNCISVMNMNMQSASTGDAHASDNTTVGGVTTGSATNTNNTTTSISVTN